MNKKDVKNKEDLELYYNKCRKIRLSEEFIPAEDLDKFTLQIINNILIEKCRTFTVRLKHQCFEGKDRSLDDIIRIYKYYKPELTLTQIITSFEKFLYKSYNNPQGFTCFIRYRYCPDIKKLNYFIANFAEHVPPNKNSYVHVVSHSGFTNAGKLSYLDFKL